MCKLVALEADGYYEAREIGCRDSYQSLLLEAQLSTPRLLSCTEKPCVN
jgi:hypothetical protein